LPAQFSAHFFQELHDELLGRKCRSAGAVGVVASCRRGGASAGTGRRAVPLWISCRPTPPSTRYAPHQDSGSHRQQQGLRENQALPTCRWAWPSCKQKGNRIRPAARGRPRDPEVERSLTSWPTFLQRVLFTADRASASPVELVQGISGLFLAAYGRRSLGRGGAQRKKVTCLGEFLCRAFLQALIKRVDLINSDWSWAIRSKTSPAKEQLGTWH